MCNLLKSASTRILLIVLSLGIHQAFAQNGIIGSGFSSGWSNPGNIGCFSAGAGSSRIYTANPGGTGNQYFRMVRAWSGNNSEFSPSASCCGGCDLQVSTFNTEVFAANTNCTNGAWYINCPNTTDNYVFKTPDGASGTSFVVFRVQGTVQSVSSVSQAPLAASVAAYQPVVVTAVPSAALASGQAVYIRYTTNGYSTSTVAQMSFSGGNYTSTIPGYAPGTNVSYYIFTSGTANVASNGSNADLYTINLNNNGGSNYSYTVANLYLSAATGNYNTGATWLGGIVPPSGAAIQILNSHNVTLNTAATVSAITINTGGTFTGSDGSPRTLTISNNTTGTNFSKSGTWANGTGGSTVNFTGSAIHTISGTTTFQNVSTSTGLNFGTSSTISGNFQINAGGYVNANPPTYSVGSILTYATGGSYGRGLEWSATSGAGYPNNVQIISSTTVDLGNGGTGTARACAGNLTINDGCSLTMANGGNAMSASLTVNGNITLGSAGTANLTLSTSFGGDLNIGGNWTRNATSTLVNNNRQVSFTGGTLQTITGQTTFDYLRMNNSGGVQLNNAITVNQQLDLSNGKITLGTNNLTITSGGAIINASTSSYVITNSTGQLLRQVDGTTRNFPVGFNSTFYTPVSLKQNGTADQIGVRCISAPPFTNAPNSTARMVGVEWVLNEAVAGGNSLEAAFTWNVANEGGSFVRANGVFQGDWNGSAYDVRNATLSGTDPYTSTSVADYTGNLSAHSFIVGNINGILSCLSTVADGDWNSGATWSGGIVPPAGATVCLNHNITTASGNPNTAGSVTLNSSSSLDIASGRTLTISAGGSIVNSTGAAVNLGAGTVTFSGSGTVTGNPITLTNLNLNGSLNNLASISLVGTMTIYNSAGAIGFAINYQNTSTLVYAHSGTRTVGTEWYINSTTAGNGTPQNVIISNGSTLNLPNSTIGMGGNLTISGTLNMSATIGDIVIGGNWYRSTTGTFNPNNRAVFFSGSNPSTITVEGGGTETFNYLSLFKTSNTVTLSSSPATDVVVNASAGNVIGLGNICTLNLNGRTLSLTGTSGGIRTVSGANQITGSAGSVFQISNGLKSVNSASGGTLTFGSNVTVNLNEGIDFGAGLCTINGVLQISPGGYVSGNAATYASGSILRYYSGNTYGRGQEWSATTGAGYPFHVEIVQNGTNTILDLSNGGSAIRRCGGNLTIGDGASLTMNTMTNQLEVLGNVLIGSGTSGDLTLSTNFGGDLYVAGNLTRSSGGAFNQNSREVIFNGTNNQTITGVNTFDYLRTQNTGTSPANRVILTANTTINNRLFLDGGQLDMGAFSVTMANNSQIRRSLSTSTMTSAPTIGGTDMIDLRYDATMNTGIEMPSAATSVRDFEISAGTLTLSGNTGLSRDLKLAGDLNLAGYTITLRGRSSTPAVNGNIEITTGTRSITSSPAGGVFDIVGLGGNSPIEFTKTVTNPGSGTLTFSSDVFVGIADGRMDWGSGNPVTINGTMQVKLGGSVYPNACYYGINSTLRFANTVDYGVPSTDITWSPGAINSGLPGIPWNVEVNDAGTDLQLQDTRALRGSLTITNGTFTLTNTYTGSFNLGGNWTRTGATSSFVHNQNPVVFDRQSAGDQTITVGSGVSAETFYDLEISPVSGNVLLASSTNLNVENNLNFASGKLDMNSSSNVLTIGISGTNGSVTGFGTSNYIIPRGAAVIEYANSNASYVFPVGDASNYTPMTVDLSNGGQSGASLSTTLVTSTHPNIGTATSYIGRYWSVVPSGLASSPVYDVTYTYAAADVVGVASTLYPTKYSSLGWIASPGSGANAIDGSSANHNTGSRTFNWSGITTFSDFTAAGDGSPLPVELLNFSATAVNDAVQIDWTTASEINNDYFIVERSANLIDFTQIGRIEGVGNATLLNSYNLTDNQPISGVSYYRLTQVDLNGESETFAPVAVNFSNSFTGVQIYPNPASDFTFTQIHSSGSDLISADIFDLVGRRVMSKTLTINKGENLIRLDLSELPVGSYLITLKSEKRLNFNQKLIVK